MLINVLFDNRWQHWIFHKKTINPNRLNSPSSIGNGKTLILQPNNKRKLVESVIAECLQWHPEDRPSMEWVVKRLEGQVQPLGINIENKERLFELRKQISIKGQEFLLAEQKISNRIENISEMLKTSTFFLQEAQNSCALFLLFFKILKFIPFFF